MQKEADVYARLDKAADQLRQARQALFRDEPNHAASLESSLQAIRGAFAAYLTWHRVVFSRRRRSMRSRGGPYPWPAACAPARAVP